MGLDAARKADIKRAKVKEQTGEDIGENSFIEVMVESYRTKETWNGNTYTEVYVSDGTERVRVNIWGDDLSEEGQNGPKMIRKGNCLRLEVRWQEKYQSFSVISRSRIVELERDPDAARE